MSNLPAIAQERGIDIAQWNTLLNVLYPRTKPEVAVVAWDYCKAKGLDPMLKPMHIVEYSGNVTFVPGIGLYRTIATRTNQYMGMDKPDFVIENGQLLECYVTVYRYVQGHRCAFTGHADFKEMGKNTKTWKEMPRHMLAIRAEADALRKAFPEEVGSEPTYEEVISATKEISTTAEDIAVALDAEFIEQNHDWTLPHEKWTPEQWVRWKQNLSTKIGHCQTLEELYALTDNNEKRQYLAETPELDHLAMQLDEAIDFKTSQLKTLGD